MGDFFPCKVEGTFVASRNSPIKTDLCLTFCHLLLPYSFSLSLSFYFLSAPYFYRNLSSLQKKKDHTIPASLIMLKQDHTAPMSRSCTTASVFSCLVFIHQIKIPHKGSYKYNENEKECGTLAHTFPVALKLDL